MRTSSILYGDLGVLNPTLHQSRICRLAKFVGRRKKTTTTVLQETTHNVNRMRRLLQTNGVDPEKINVLLYSRCRGLLCKELLLPRELLNSECVWLHIVQPAMECGAAVYTFRIDTLKGLLDIFHLYENGEEERIDLENEIETCNCNA